jgi:hypothetical protein
MVSTPICENHTKFNIIGTGTTSGNVIVPGTTIRLAEVTTPEISYNNIRYMNMSENTKTVTVATDETIVFYDSGGPFDNYYENENKTWHFTSANGAPISIRIDNFVSYPSSSYRIYFYDGASTTALASLYGSAYSNSQNSTLPRTITASSGTLRVVWKS